MKRRSGLPSDPRWTYTVNGELPPKKVQVRQVKLSNTVFLDDNGEMVLDIECVREPAPDDWPVKKRFSVIMVGVGQQVGPHFYITQWASDWEKELLDAVRPTLALASKVYIEARGDFDTEVLAGQWVSGRSNKWGDKPMWPAIDIRTKTENVRRLLRQQGIGAQIDRNGDIRGKDVLRLWPLPKDGQRDKSWKDGVEKVWKHNYLDVLETSKKVFQIERPEGPMKKFRVKALCKLRTGTNKDITRILDAEDEEDVRKKMRQRFSVVTFHWIKKI